MTEHSWVPAILSLEDRVAALWVLFFPSRVYGSFCRKAVEKQNSTGIRSCLKPWSRVDGKKDLRCGLLGAWQLLCDPAAFLLRKARLHDAPN